jgi:hypothetical protein
MATPALMLAELQALIPTTILPSGGRRTPRQDG